MKYPRVSVKKFNHIRESRRYEIILCMSNDKANGDNKKNKFIKNITIYVACTLKKKKVK